MFKTSFDFQNFLKFCSSNINLYNLNISLAIGILIALCSHTFLSRGLDEDGSFNLVKLILENQLSKGPFIHHEVSRLFFNIFHQIPAWLFIKFSSSENLSVLAQIYSFSLIGPHILSLSICYFILPLKNKKLIFFPLFAFATGPLTTLGISVSVALSVCSYVWMTVYVIYYSNLSNKIHQALFIIIPLPLLLSHELMAYMAWPIIGLCLLKAKAETHLFNNLIIKFIIAFFIYTSIISLMFIFTVDPFRINTFADFKSSLWNLEFLFSKKSINLSILTAIILKSSLFIQCLSDNIKKIQLTLSILLIFSFLLTSFLPFSVYNRFFFIEDYPARVWPPIFSLPLNLLLWWLYENKKITVKNAKIFLLSCFIFSVTSTVYRVKSDWQFYKHQKQFSKQIQRCKGFLSWPSVKKNFKSIENYEKLEENLWKISSVSLIYPRSKNIKAIILNTSCIALCIEEKKDQHLCRDLCNDISFNMPASLSEHLLKTRFFNFEALTNNISKNLSLCEK